MNTFFVPLLWPAWIITFLLIRMIVKKSLEKPKKWTHYLLLLFPMLTNLCLLRITWSAMFDQEVRANGSSMGVALVLYCILITFFLLAVIWPVAKEFKYANRFIKAFMIILILTQYFPVVREDALDFSRNYNSGALLGISQNTAEGCAVSMIGSSRKYSLVEAKKDGSDWMLTYKIYGKNGSVYLDQETYFVNARSCKADRLEKGRASEINLTRDGKPVGDAEMLLNMYSSSDLPNISANKTREIFDYQVTDSQGKAKIITDVDSSYIRINSPVFYLYIFKDGQGCLYKLPSQFQPSYNINLNMEKMISS